jgi:peptide/nickel transport system permease protein
MIFDGQQHLRIAPWMSIFPGIAMLIVVCALNLVGDGLNYAVNPQLRERSVPKGMKAPKLAPSVASNPDAESRESVDTTSSLQLDVRDLSMYYAIERGWVRAVDGVSIKLGQGQSIGLAGESGCGKTSVGIAIMRVLPRNGRIMGGEALLDGREILEVSEESFKQVRWTEISMIFQSAMNALDPVKTVGSQLTDVYKLHRPDSSRSEALDRVDELFDIVGIPRERTESYPHELSGGMRQRVMISLALLLEPKVIIADEPTTALDVLVQDQILAELERLQEKMNLSFILISHDIGILTETCDEIAVMYAGQIVEQAGTKAILTNPRHPYTSGLLGSLPRLTGPRKELITLPGESTVMMSQPQGCRFAPRCPLATELCYTVVPELIAYDANHTSRCHYALTPDVESAWQVKGEPHA